MVKEILRSDAGVLKDQRQSTSNLEPYRGSIEKHLLKYKVNIQVKSDFLQSE